MVLGLEAIVLVFLIILLGWNFLLYNILEAS